MARMRATLSTPFCIEITGVPAGQQTATSSAADSVLPPLTHNSSTWGVSMRTETSEVASVRWRAGTWASWPSISFRCKPVADSASMILGRPTSVTRRPAAANRPPM